jgi:hypothetical protein
MNKKAFVQDYLFFAVFVFVLALIIIVGSRIHTDVNDKWQDLDVAQQAKDIMQQNTNKYYDFMDYLFFTVFFLFIMALGAGVFLLDTHPFLYWVAVILLGFALIPIGILSNVYDEFTSNSSMATEAARFGIIETIYSNPGSVVIFGVIGIVVIILLMNKNR